MRPMRVASDRDSHSRLPGFFFGAGANQGDRPVAVKVLAPYLAGSGAARKRFAREARAAAAIVHEHVVPIHNVETEGEPSSVLKPPRDRSAKEAR